MGHISAALSDAEHNHNGISGSERSALSKDLARLKHLYTEAEKENTTIYQEEVPPAAALSKIEHKVKHARRCPVCLPFPVSCSLVRMGCGAGSC